MFADTFFALSSLFSDENKVQVAGVNSTKANRGIGGEAPLILKVSSTRQTRSLDPSR